MQGIETLQTIQNRQIRVWNIGYKDKNKTIVVEVPILSMGDILIDMATVFPTADFTIAEYTEDYYGRKVKENCVFLHFEIVPQLVEIAVRFLDYLLDK